MSGKVVLGQIIRTTPPSSPLDTLKALVLRNIDRLDYVLDQLGGSSHEVDEELIEFIFDIRKMQYEALAEHVHVASDERLGELRHIHPDGYLYDDGSPAQERFESQYGTSIYHPRYDGSRDKALAWHKEWTSKEEQRVKTELEFGNVIRGNFREDI